MIKCDSHTVEVCGGKISALAEFSCVVRCMNMYLIKEFGYTSEEARRSLDFAYNNGFATDEELKRESLFESVGRILDNYFKIKETKDGE